MRAVIRTSSPTRLARRASSARDGRRRSRSTPSPSSGSRALEPPSTTGARNRRISSISPASRNAPARCGPPSSRIEVTPRRAELRERVAHAGGLVARRWRRRRRRRRPPARRSRRAARRARRRRSAAPRAAPRTSCESSGRRASESKTIRRGWRRTPSMRAVSCGSSASAVPMPTATASHLGAPVVREPARVLAGDPLRVAGAGRDLAVERHRRLEQHPRPARAGVLAERLVEQPRPRGQLAVGERRPRRPRRAGSPGRGPAAFSVGSSEATTTRAMPGREDRLGARRRAARGGSTARARRRASRRAGRRRRRRRSRRPRRARRRARSGSPRPAPGRR